MKKLIAQKISDKTKRDYQILAEEFSQTRQHCWPIFKQLVKPLQSGERVLDIGCGNGRLAKLLVNKNVRYLGIDNCAPLIKLAQENFLSHPQINFQAGDILQIPVEADSFDTVFCLAMLHHLPSADYRRQALAEMKRVVKPNGRIILMVWNLYQCRYWKYLIKYSLDKLFHKDLSSIISDLSANQLDIGDVFIPWRLSNKEIVQRYYHAFCPKELKKLVKQTNLKIIKHYFSPHRRNLLIIAQKKSPHLG